MSSTFDSEDLNELLVLGPDDVDTEDFVFSLTFECLSDTPRRMKNALYSTKIKKYTDLQQLASDIELMFPSDLGDKLKSGTAPTIEWFKSLPSFYCPGFIVYVLVLTKRGCRPKIYIGSGTDEKYGGKHRLESYDKLTALPSLVKQALAEGYAIVHKGLLAWTTTLPRAGLVPMTRLLFMALEGTFSFNFWAMRAYKRDYGMGHMCLWPRSDLEYDGLCSHCCLYEGVRRNFDLSDEQLEEIAILVGRNHREKAAILTHNWNVAFKQRDPDGYRAWTAANGAKYHHKQMETNHDGYLARKLNERTVRYAAHPEKLVEETKAWARRKTEMYAENRANKNFFCTDCNLACRDADHYSNHLNTPTHKKTVNADRTSPLWCGFCFMLCASENVLKYSHLVSDLHRNNVIKFEAQQAAEAYDALELEAYELAEAEFDGNLEADDMDVMEFELYLD
ncbi:hypothetical protein KCU62_g8888, partial [Aureobasidium sp. EXF-3399]